MKRDKRLRTQGPLSAAAARWYRQIAGEYQLESHHLRLLEAAAGAWDRVQSARAILDEEGLCTTDRFGQRRAHPMANVERDNKILFARLLRELNLDDDGPDDPRPPRVGRRD
jgi:phage terminase small subunit